MFQTLNSAKEVDNLEEVYALAVDAFNKFKPNPNQEKPLPTPN